MIPLSLSNRIGRIYTALFVLAAGVVFHNPSLLAQEIGTDEALNGDAQAVKKSYDALHEKYSKKLESMSNDDFKNKFFLEIMEDVSSGDDRIQELEQLGDAAGLVIAYNAQAKLIEQFLEMIETSDSLGSRRHGVLAELDRLEKDGASRHEETQNRYSALRKVFADIESSTIKEGDFELAQEQLEELSLRCSLLQSDIDRLFELQWRAAQEAFRVASDSMDTELLAVRKLRPSFSAAQSLHQRVKKRYRIVPLLKAAQADERDKNHAQAISLYESILELDPMTEEAQGKVQEIEALASEQIIKESLREALELITDGKPNMALVPAKRALKLSQVYGFDVTSAQSLVDRAKRDDRSEKVRFGTQQIRIALDNKDWGNVITVADSVLNIQPGDHFASTAREKAVEQRRQIASMVEVIAQGNFHLDKASQEMDRPLVEYVVNLLDESRAKYPDAVDENFVVLEKRSKELLASFDSTIDVEFVSNRRTEIELRGYGKLGKFSRKTVALKPGKYKARCTQKGYRDRLIEIEIRPGENREPILLEAGKKF
ncbi:hypothetical protein MLD52_15535 [Puniceicoccaceae bacterium K14]|nr:hypothetical protein [Puniceicoccaceae bacterium K14]